MNLILTAYLTGGKDGQTGQNWQPNRKAIDPLINSFLSVCSKNEQLIVFHDCFGEFDFSGHGQVFLVKVDSNPSITANRYRWTIFKEYLEQNMVHNVFCVDSRDVEIFKNPFQEPFVNFCSGFEKRTKVKSEWMRTAQQPFVNLADYKQVINENKEHCLLNCGISGGQYTAMLLYLTYICKYQNQCNPPNNKSIDMAIHNYTIFKHFKDRFEYGSHINTEFRGNEKSIDNNKALFKHK